jgi:hypothetical protein
VKKKQSLGDDRGHGQDKVGKLELDGHQQGMNPRFDLSHVEILNNGCRTVQATSNSSEQYLSTGSRLTLST